jgi:hypothetical protein
LGEGEDKIMPFIPDKLTDRFIPDKPLGRFIPDEPQYYRPPQVGLLELEEREREKEWKKKSLAEKGLEIGIKGIKQQLKIYRDITSATAYTAAGIIKGATLNYIQPEKWLEEVEKRTGVKPEISKEVAEITGQFVGAVVPIGVTARAVSGALKVGNILKGVRPILQRVVQSGITGGLYGFAKKPEEEEKQSRLHNALDDTAYFIAFTGAGVLFDKAIRYYKLGKTDLYNSLRQDIINKFTSNGATTEKATQMTDIGLQEVIKTGGGWEKVKKSDIKQMRDAIKKGHKIVVGVEKPPEPEPTHTERATRPTEVVTEVPKEVVAEIPKEEVIPVKPKEKLKVEKVKVVPAKKGLEILPRKEQLLTQIQEALAKAPSDTPFSNTPKITFQIDGGAKIYNAKSSLQQFYDIIKRQPEVEVIGVEEKKKAIPRPIASRQEKMDKLLKTDLPGYYTDGRAIIKGIPPSKFKFDKYEGRGVGADRMKEHLNQPTEPATKLYYYSEDPSFGVGVSPTPMAMKESFVVFKSPIGYNVYEQSRLNIISNRFPNASFGISKKGSLIAYVDKEPVAVLMGVKLSESTEIGVVKEPPLRELAEKSGLIETEIPKEVEGKKPLAQYSISPEDYKKVIAGESTGRMLPSRKVIPPVTATKEPIEWEKTPLWQVNLGRNITGVFEREIGPSLQVSKRMKTWLGVYYPMLGESGTIRVRSIADETTLNHETGHFLDDVLGKYPIEKRGDLRDELIKVAKYIRPFEEGYQEVVSPTTGKITKAMDTYTKYRRSRSELFADYVSVYTAEPEMVKSLSPKFTGIVESEISKDKEFKYIVDKLREFQSAFKPIKDFVNLGRKIPELEPLLTEWERKVNPISAFWRREVGDKIWNIMKSLGQRLSELPVGRELAESRGLPSQVFELLRQRLKLIKGQQARFTEEIIKPISKLTKEEQQGIAERLMQWDLRGKTNTDLDLLTEEARKEIAVWGNESRKAGLLNDAVFWDNVGQYFPFMYSTKEFDVNKSKLGYFPSKAIKANLSGVKHKLTDVEFGMRVLEAQLGTWPSAKKKIAEYTKSKLAEIGRKAREEMGLIKTAAYPLQKRISQLIEAVYTVKTMNAIAKVPGIIGDKTTPRYAQMPTGKKYGQLSGQYVPENLVRYVNDWTKMPGDLAKIVNAVISVFKTFKVPMDPSAASRNIINNIITAYLNDVPIQNPVVLAKGISSFVSGDNIYKSLRDNGLYNNTYSSEELQRLSFIAEDPENIWGKMLENVLKVYNVPGKAYGVVEDIFKTAAARYAIDNGASILQAIKLADKCFYDYSQVSKIVEVVRKFPLPFITWTAKTLPRLIETAVRRPEKLIIILGIITSYNAMSRISLGITKEDEERLKPDYIRGKTVLLLPFRDKDGRLQWIDLSYLMPWEGFMPIQKGKLGIPLMVTMGNPFISLYNCYILNHDPFYGVIVKEGTPESEAERLQSQYLLKSLGPTLFTMRIPKIIKSITTPEQPYKQELGQILLGELVGIRFVKDISEYREKILGKIDKLKAMALSNVKKRLKSGEISEKEHDELVMEIQKEHEANIKLRR